MENEKDFSIEGATRKKKRSLGRQCAAFGCYSTFYNTDGLPSGLHFFKFPQTNPGKFRWCSLIKRVDGLDDFKVTSCTCLCEKHFTDADIKKNPNRWSLKKGALPSLSLFLSTTDKLPKPKRKSPTKRLLPASSSSTSSVSCPPEENESFLSDTASVSTSISISTQTDFSFVTSPTYVLSSLSNSDHICSEDVPQEDDLLTFCTQYESLSLKTKELTSSVESLKLQIIDLEKQIKLLKNSLFSVKKLEQDDSAIKFYTGFPNFASLLAVFEYFQPKLDHIHYWRGSQSSSNSSFRYQQTNDSSKPGPTRSLTQLEEFILVLMRLKVGLFINDLADRFGISIGHVSKIFTTWINFLFLELPLLFPFPSQQRIRRDMPKQFEEYPTTRIIIDCTEIFCEVPSSLKSQSQTWSDYKHHNTWKALVGISPTGCITFVSKLWSGRVSDKEITEKCGVLGLLEDGDNIMADRGFDVADILPAGVTLNIPPFKGNRPQLSAHEVEETARIASVRIHVERAIGRIKNYHILDGVMPLSLQPVLNQVFSVCCLLANFQPFLVPPSSSESD